MKKILVTIFLMQSLISGCSANNFDAYKDEINELLQDPKDRKIKGNENDVNDLSGCPILFKLSEWKIRKIGIEKIGNIEYIWDRDYSWIKKDNTVSEPNIGLDRIKLHLSNEILKSASYPVYIGPWHHSPKLQKQIRFFAFQPVEGGPISYQYESQTEQNKSIPEKPFHLSPQAKFAPDKFSLCVVKWTAKYGYNAVIDLHKNPWYPFFSKDYLVGSGKIIEAKE